MIYSTTKEPLLKEWTSRAEICDGLHEPVSLPVVVKVRVYIYQELLPESHLYVSVIYRSELPWLESTQAFPMPISRY